MPIRKQRKNLNKHTESGTRLLGESIKRDGYIGAITVAADMETFDGSNRIEVGGNDFDEAVIVHTDGSKPVVVVRDDIPNTDDPKAQRLGFTANQIASADLAFDYKELSDFLTHDPIADAIARDDYRIRNALEGGNPIDPNAEWEGMPEFHQEDKTAWKSIIVHFESPDNLKNFAELVEQTVTEKTKFIWYPKQEIQSIHDAVFTNES